MLNITKTTKIIAFAFMLALIIPTAASAAKDNSGGFDWSGSGWDDYSYGSGSSYYYDTPSYDYSYGYTPDYSYDYGYDSGYDSGYYGGYDDYYTPQSYGYDYTTPSYTGSYSSGSSYVPSTSYSYSSSNPVTTSNSDSNSNSSAKNETIVTSANTNTSTNANQNNSNASATGGNSSSSATGGNAVNNNVNNVYVYTNPTGTAVVNNPAYQRLDGYCVITPSNPKTGQTVTATAYMTGGIGEYTYVWGGDLTSSLSGVSASFTSYTTGTKNITVTARSGQDVKTVSCTVTFQNQSSTYSYAYTPTVSSGTSVSGVYVQPSYIKSGTSVSGVYLNDLPATGISLNWMHYMIAIMVVILAAVATYISKNKTRFTGVASVE